MNRCDCILPTITVCEPLNSSSPELTICLDCGACWTPDHGMRQEIIDGLVFAARMYYPKPEPKKPALRLVKK